MFDILKENSNVKIFKHNFRQNWGMSYNLKYKINYFDFCSLSSYKCSEMLNCVFIFFIV